MKTRKNLAVRGAQLFAAVVMVMVCGLFASCNKDMDVDEGLQTYRSVNRNGWKHLNDSTYRDSVIVDGEVDKIDLSYSIQAIERREFVLDNFNNPYFEEVFSSGEPELIRNTKIGNWSVNNFKQTFKKIVEVGGQKEYVTYTAYYQEAVHVPTSTEFKSDPYAVANDQDWFEEVDPSTKEGYTEMDYFNQIRATYRGKAKYLTEEIGYFVKGDVPVPDVPTVDHHEATGDRNDYTTHTAVTYEKFAIYTDGTRESVEKDGENIQIRIVPETNWTINVDNLGTYVSNAFAINLISKTPRKQGNFSYNEYCYRVYNTVAGQTNSFLVYVPNDIVREDKDARMEYKNTDLVVAKGAESTTFKTEDDSKKVYDYRVTANVTFGANQNVTLPGTINVKKEVTPPANHEHGKVKEVLFTSTINEDRSFYKSVAVIVFEDGYRSIGMTDNDSKTFSFNMSSYTNGVNSTVYTGSKWIPSIAVDENSDGCMVWYDENYSPKRTYDFLSANRNRWNNGHNTVVDVRRSYTIIDGGYGVTLKLNGASGQTLHF
jgi:hypothetical protein